MEENLEPTPCFHTPLKTCLTLPDQPPLYLAQSKLHWGEF